MSDTYRDGIGGERCSTCHSLLRLKGGAPQVSVDCDDVEFMICVIADGLDELLEILSREMASEEQPPADTAQLAGIVSRWEARLARFEHNLGCSVEQIRQKVALRHARVEGRPA